MMKVLSRVGIDRASVFSSTPPPFTDARFLSGPRDRRPDANCILSRLYVHPSVSSRP